MNTAKFLVTFFFSIFIEISSVGASDFDSWLSYRIKNNNRIFADASEQERFRYTVINYSKRLKSAKACDPRTSSETFPFDERTLRRKRGFCKNHAVPALTNKQFRTEWNPVKHLFNTNYLIGKASKKRAVVLNLKIPGNKAFTRGAGYDCDWEVREPGSTEQAFHSSDCKSHTVTVETDKKYEVRATVYRYRTQKRRKTKLVHTSSWFSIKIRDHIVVAMGDSFGSGEGNPHTFVPTGNPATVSRNKRPAAWLDPRCHRSLLSSSGLALNVLSSKYQGVSFSLVNLACSGAESGVGLIENFVGRASASQVARSWKKHSGMGVPTRSEDGFLGYKYGQRPNLPSVANNNNKSRPAPYDIPSQTAQLAEALNCKDKKCERQPSAIFLYIGINDIGFSDSIIKVILNCAKREKCVAETGKKVSSGLKKTRSNLAKFKSTLENIGIHKSTPVFLVKYPNPLRYYDGKKLRFCNSEKAKNRDLKIWSNDRQGAFLGSFASALGFIIDSDGARFSEKKILRPLNKTLTKFAAQHPNWFVIDRTKQMQGSGFCARKRMFNRYSDSVVKQGYIEKNYFWSKHNCKRSNCRKYNQFPLPTGAMHPNYSGHREIAVGLINGLESKLKLQKTR